ncbi:MULTISPECIES: peptide chain release factor-like protein [unclassified Variovorax]|uniref:peptide chain release factor-like protein n=1 Tax=unclassified Variovorax TaxID=663243 RepID=UPI0013181654|nr:MULTISPECIES: peptide chain release factor-like protein [unclassified Variovorax]VTU41662.1 Peptide chain release factor 1 [Variovorax sp. SRS16]VTU44720.1 Peptide chain release factor 1 [Variovorax sp. PBL-H6]
MVSEALAADLSLEAGGHRWQRVPPTERRGRVHSSTVTIAVRQTSKLAFVLDEAELDERFKRSTGPGGQHRNKSDCCVVLTHRATGITVTVDSRSQADNRREARVEMARRLKQLWDSGLSAAAASDKRRQVGTGQRGDKVRTYSAQHGIVTDHRTGRKAPLEAVQAGRLDLLR